MVDFHSARLFFSYYSLFWPPEKIVNIIVGVYRPISIFTVFWFFYFWAFLPFLDTSGIFGASVEISGILGVLVSYEVTRWIILVVARVHDGFEGGSGGSWGVLEGSGVVPRGSATLL